MSMKPSINPENYPMNSRSTNYSQECVYSMEKKASLAQSLSKPFITGDLYGEQESRHFLSSSNDGELEDMYLEEIVHTGDKIYVADKRKRDKNIRAKLGFLDLILYDLKVRYRRWRNKQWEFPLFKAKIKYIESNFGSGIGSLFVFTRWVFCLNFILCILWFGMVVLPTAVTYSYRNVTLPFAFKNLVDGKGAVAQLWLFYGSYGEKLHNKYHLSLAYLAMILLTYFGSLFIIFKSLADSKQPKSSTSIEGRFLFSLLVMSSWDHSITSSEASFNLSKGITSVLKDNLYEAKAMAESQKRSKRDKYKVYALRFLAWFFTIILIGGGCSAIAVMVIYVNFANVLPSEDSAIMTEKDDFFTVYGTTIIFSLINILVPLTISKLPRIEQYDSGKTELSVTLFRIFFLRLANLIALIVSLYSNLNKKTFGCTGTVIGQEFYKLVVMDTLVHACVKLSMSFGKYFWSRQKSEFDIPAAVLVLIYRQGLVWVGTIACPVLPFLGLLSNVVFFYLNYIIVRKTCKPPIKRWNQSRNTSFLMGYLLATLITIIVPVSVVVGSYDIIKLGHDSVRGQDCGPFGASKPTSAYTNFAKEQVEWLKACFTTLTSDTVLIPVFLIILSLLYYQSTLIKSLGQHKLMLQAELHQEREDNQKLLKKIQGM